jgi:UDP-glucuronate 4-epimerase
MGKKAIKEMHPMQPGDVPRTFADINDLIKEYNYKPKTPINKGIKEFITWYKNYI